MNLKTILAVSAVFTASMSALHADNHTLFVHHSNGITPILYAEIDSICFSSIGVDSVVCPSKVVQEIWTTDSVYRYNIADITSTSFEAPATVAREGSVNLEEELAPYIDGLDSGDDGETVLVLTSSVPEHLIPEKGRYLYQLNCSEKLPYGFAGIVTDVSGTRIEYADAEIRDIFDSLAWDAQSVVETEPLPVAQNDDVDGVKIETGWLAAVNTYPYGESVIAQMTDELRDIPAGPEEPRVRSKIRVRPSVSISAGIYLFGGKRDVDGEWIEQPYEIHRMSTSLSTPVEIHVDGRASVDAEHSFGSDRKLTFSRPLGLGRMFSVSFSGTMKLKGKMGLDYDYKAAYNAKSFASTMVSDDLAAIKGSFINNVLEVPQHLLDASMEGVLTLSASITATFSNPSDSLKSMSSTFVFGSSLDGKALYLTSQLDEAATNNALYRRITNLGVKASPIETVTASSRYGSETLKAKSTTKPTASTVFYAVPLFKSPSYSNGVMTYGVEGQAMKGHSSRLGLALFDSNGSMQEISTMSVWPGASNLVGNVAADFTKSDIIYPTATLCGKTVLGAPAYPDNNRSLSPLLWTLNNQGTRIVCGMPVVSKAANGKTAIYVGNIITLPKPKKKN